MMNYSEENNEKKVKSHKSQKKKIKNKAFTVTVRVLVITILVAMFASVGALAGVYIAIIQDAPSLTVLEATIAPTNENSIVFEARTGMEIDRFIGEANRQFVPLSQIPDHLINAFIAIEDRRFFEHRGVDLRATLRAIYITLTTPQTQGGSTITQQLIKNNVMGLFRNDVRTKLQEQYLAIRYEQLLVERLGSRRAAKEHILELYLNTIGLHRGNGVQAASLRYFNKDVSELTISESAVIASITQSPVFFDPVRNPENNRTRQVVVLHEMYSQGFITAAELQEALDDDVHSRILATNVYIEENASVHSYFVDLLFENLVRDLQERLGYTASLANFMIFNGGLHIFATKNTDMQAIVDRVYLDDSLFPAQDYEVSVTYILSRRNIATGAISHVERTESIPHFDMLDSLIDRFRDDLLGTEYEMLAENIQPVVQPQSAIVIMDHFTGEVRALSGGRGDKLANRVWNRASDALRQPGSVFKVLASFAPALDLGLITPATVFDDVPFSVGNWSPRNWYTNPSYRGLSSVRDAIRDSMNLVTVQNFVNTGSSTIFDYLLNFGFTTLADNPADHNGMTDRNASTSLGGITYGVNMIELSAAFAAIANQGQYLPPILYTHVLDRNGNVILDNRNPEPRQVLRPTTAYLLIDMMKCVVTSPVGTPTGHAARFREVDMPVAGKTGTTNDVRDLFFVGSTPFYTAALYLGHDMPRTIRSSGYHLTLWRAIMEEIHRDLPRREFERPPGIVAVDVCRISGLLPIPGVCNQDHRGAREGGGMIRTELFVSGTQPTTFCNVHQSVTVNMHTGYVASDYCPPDSLQTVIGIVRPVPFNGHQFIGDAQFELRNRIPGFGVMTCPVHGPDYRPVMPYDEFDDEFGDGEFGDSEDLLLPADMSDDTTPDVPAPDVTPDPPVESTAPNISSSSTIPIDPPIITSSDPSESSSPNIPVEGNQSAPAPPVIPPQPVVPPPPAPTPVPAPIEVPALPQPDIVETPPPALAPSIAAPPIIQDGGPVMP